ncbi:hypothetical protein QQF64_018745 [Cirrhinus molitorella]|uniref:Uncharacterized protein n=1 Tax=Cirrhinus molitorella TaxID=172907 RepID=A0ABR3LGY4_9TELE
MVNYGLVSAKNELVPLKSISVEVVFTGSVATVPHSAVCECGRATLETLFVFLIAMMLLSATSVPRSESRRLWQRCKKGRKWV